MLSLLFFLFFVSFLRLVWERLNSLLHNSFSVHLSPLMREKKRIGKNEV